MIRVTARARAAGGETEGGVKIDLNRKKSVISSGRWHLPGEMTLGQPPTFPGAREGFNPGAIRQVFGGAGHTTKTT